MQHMCLIFEIPDKDRDLFLEGWNETFAKICFNIVFMKIQFWVFLTARFCWDSQQDHQNLSKKSWIFSGKSFFWLNILNVRVLGNWNHLRIYSRWDHFNLQFYKWNKKTNVVGCNKKRNIKFWDFFLRWQFLA